MRGFSLEYHSVWQTHRPANIAPPFWLPILDRDIRKLPPPAMKRTSSAHGSGAQTAGSNGSITAGTGTESTTAVETTSQDAPTEFETPPLKSFRKKRKRRSYPRNDGQVRTMRESLSGSLDNGDALERRANPRDLEVTVSLHLYPLSNKLTLSIAATEVLERVRPPRGWGWRRLRHLH